MFFEYIPKKEKATYSEKTNNQKKIYVYCPENEVNELKKNLAIFNEFSWIFNDFKEPSLLKNEKVCYHHVYLLDAKIKRQLIQIIKCGGRPLPLIDCLENKYRYTHLFLVNEDYFLQHRRFYAVTRQSRKWLKRCMDVMFALSLLLFTWPLILIGMLGIYISSGPRVIYQQERIGRYNNPFIIYKLRTMRLDSEPDGTAQWSKDNDDRITRFGSFLRKTRIDELPQIYNILKGDMSFVGPRPERQEFVELLEQHVPWYAFRHSVKPGLTGLAQIKYGYGASIDDAMIKHRYDVYYIKNQNVLWDVKICLKTIKPIFEGLKGSLK